MENKKKDSQKRIEKVFLDLIQTKPIEQIHVSKICELAKVNRTTFYANYLDIYDLKDKVQRSMILEYADVFTECRGHNEENYLKMFRHIKAHQNFYQTYFKLGYDKNYVITYLDEKLAKERFNGRFVEYHGEFFRGGMTALIKMWLKNGCKESPEDLLEILKSEYAGYPQ